MNNLNAVKMVRDIRDKQYEETKGKSKEELKQYYKKNSEWALKKENIINFGKQKKVKSRPSEKCAKLTSPNSKSFQR